MKTVPMFVFEGASVQKQIEKMGYTVESHPSGWISANGPEDKFKADTIDGILKLIKQKKSKKVDEMALNNDMIEEVAAEVGKDKDKIAAALAKRLGLKELSAKEIGRIEKFIGEGKSINESIYYEPTGGDTVSVDDALKVAKKFGLTIHVVPSDDLTKKDLDVKTYPKLKSTDVVKKGTSYVITDGKAHAHLTGAAYGFDSGKIYGDNTAATDWLEEMGMESENDKDE